MQVFHGGGGGGGGKQVRSLIVTAGVRALEAPGL